MSTHYLIDAHTSPVLSADINEARYNVQASPAIGEFIIRVAADMPLDAEQSNVTNLLAAKYQAMQAYYATFSSIATEDFTDTPGVDSAASVNVHVGLRCTTKIGANTGVLRTNVTALGSTPAVCVVLWECFQIITDNPKTGRLTRTYQEMAANSLTAEVSFNNGANFTTASSGALLNIGGGVQGPNLILRFTNATAEPVWIGSWAVLY